MQLVRVTAISACAYQLTLHSHRLRQRPATAYPATRASQRVARRKLRYTQVLHGSFGQVSGVPLRRFSFPTLTVNLQRVRRNEHITQMSNSNLSIVFGPTLLGPPPTTGANLQDMSFQCKVGSDGLRNDTLKLTSCLSRRSGHRNDTRAVQGDLCGRRRRSSGRVKVHVMVVSLDDCPVMTTTSILSNHHCSTEASMVSLAYLAAQATGQQGAKSASLAVTYTAILLLRRRAIYVKRCQRLAWDTAWGGSYSMCVAA